MKNPYNNIIYIALLARFVKNSALKCGACSGVFEHARKSLAFLELKQQGVCNSDFRHIKPKIKNIYKEVSQRHIK